MAEILGERVAELIDNLGISQSELARRTGVKQPSIARIIKGTTRGSKFLMEIARGLGTTPEYLTGQTDESGEIEFRGGSDDLKEYVEFAADDQTLARKFGLALIPELELGYSMGGGNVIEMFEHTGVAPFKREWLRPMMKGSFNDLFVAKGEGDSMIPTLLDGDIVLIDTAQKNILQQDRIWALSYGDLGMIKRIRKLPDGGYQINSDNPAVTAITAYDGEMHVIGRVIWVGRRM